MACGATRKAEWGPLLNGQFAGTLDASVGPLRDDSGKVRHLNANDGVLQLIAQFVWSVEPGVRDAGRYGMCVRHPLR